MRIVRKRPARSAQEAPRHPEVDQENTTALEPNNQILAATLDGGDVFPFELGRHLGGLVRAYEARVVDAHPLEAPADERGLELPANALDLRQLRHTASVNRVAESCRAPYGATMGCPGIPRDGALPPSQAFTVAPTSANSPSWICPAAFRPST